MSRSTASAFSPRAIWDTCALLTLFKAVNRVGRVDGNLKVQKVTFLAELAGVKEGLRVAGFRFFRYTFGPYSDSLDRLVLSLETDGFLTGHGRTLTPRAEYILEAAQDAIAADETATRAVHLLSDVGKKYGRRSGTDLKEMVYDLKVEVRSYRSIYSAKIRDIQQGVDIIDPATDAGLDQVAPFDQETLAEISAELEMDPRILDRDSADYKATIAAAVRRAASACP